MTAQADDAVQRAEDLWQLRESYRARLARSRSRASEVVDLLFDNPFVTARTVAKRLKITDQGALNLIHKLENYEWLNQIGTIGRGGRVLAAREVYEIITRAPAGGEIGDEGEPA